MLLAFLIFVTFKIRLSPFAYGPAPSALPPTPLIFNITGVRLTMTLLSLSFFLSWHLRGNCSLSSTFAFFWAHRTSSKLHLESLVLLIEIIPSQSLHHCLLCPFTHGGYSCSQMFQLHRSSLCQTGVSMRQKPFVAVLSVANCTLVVACPVGSDPHPIPDASPETAWYPDRQEPEGTKDCTR